MRVGILGLLHESNTFLPQFTRFQDFADETLTQGVEILDRFRHASHEIGGFLEGLERAGIEPVPLFVARALPFGPIDEASFDRLIDLMMNALQSANRLDGLLVAPHGATVSQKHQDADGFWLRQIRECVGENVPIIGTMDPHANLSSDMAAACDALIAYRTNPHVDQRDRGIEAAQLMVQVLVNGVQPTMAVRFPPLAISIECQCTEESPLRELYEISNQIREREPQVLSDSIVLGFPYADVSEMGSSVIVVTDDDMDLAERWADVLAAQLWQHRYGLVAQPLSVDEAIDRLADSPTPVCFLDMGDNVGAGSPADGTWIAHGLVKRGIGRSLMTIYDPISVNLANQAGVGSELDLQIGGRNGPLSGDPLKVACRVLSLHDGKFRESQVRHGGFTTFDQGKTAVVRTATDLTILLTSRRSVPFSLHQISSCNLEPHAFDVLVAKGVNAPIAAYRPICESLIRVNTPGFTCADMTQLLFKNRRRPMFPFEDDAHWA